MTSYSGLRQPMDLSSPKVGRGTIYSCESHYIYFT